MINLRSKILDLDAGAGVVSVKVVSATDGNDYKPGVSHVTQTYPYAFTVCKANTLVALLSGNTT